MTKAQAQAFRKAFGERLCDCRCNQGMTQAQLGRAIKTDQSAVSRMENGLQDPSPIQLAMMAVVFNCTSWDELLGAPGAIRTPNLR